MSKQKPFEIDSKNVLSSEATYKKFLPILTESTIEAEHRLMGVEVNDETQI